MSPRYGTGAASIASGDGPAGDLHVFDTSVAHIARVYDYWLGGKDNFAADRAAGDAAIAAYPGIVLSVRANRAFLARVVRYLAGEAGIRQFLDIGTGIPAANNTHEVAQAVAPGLPGGLRGQRPGGARARPRAADQRRRRARPTTSTRTCATPEKILDAGGPDPGLLPPGGGHADGDHAPDRRRGRPVRRSSAGCWPRCRPGATWRCPRWPPTSRPEQMAEAAQRYNRLAHETQRHRTHAEVARFFDGLDLVEPGVVAVQEWRPGSEIEARTRPPCGAESAASAKAASQARLGSRSHRRAASVDEAAFIGGDDSLDAVSDA